MPRGGLRAVSRQAAAKLKMAVKTLAPATVSYLSEGIDMPAAFPFSPVVSITYPASDDDVAAQPGRGNRSHDRAHSSSTHSAGDATQPARRGAHKPGGMGDASSMDLGSAPLQSFARPLILHMPHCFDPADAADSIVMLVSAT